MNSSKYLILFGTLGLTTLGIGGYLALKKKKKNNKKKTGAVMSRDELVKILKNYKKTYFSTFC